MKVFKSAMLFLLFSALGGSAARGAGNAARYFDGLEAMSDSRFADAVSAIDDAIAANDQIGIYYVDRAVALMALERGPEAGEALHKAAQLNQQDEDSRVWSYAWVLMFNLFTPPPATHGPPFLLTPYADGLLTAAAGYQSARTAAERERCLAFIRQQAAEFGGNQFTNTGAAALLARVASLDEARRYTQCIALVEKARSLSQQPIDGALIGHDAHSRLGLGDFGAARAEYTAALRQYPTDAGLLIERTRCEIAMGSLSDAEADIDCAKLADPDGVAKQGREVDGLMAAARGTPGGGTSASLGAALADAAAAGKSDDALATIAEPLWRARLAERFKPEEQFTREYCRLRRALDLDPGNNDKKLDLASFLLRPTVLRKVTVEGATEIAPVPCGGRELNPAGHLLAEVLRADPKNLRALEQSALLLAMRGRISDMTTVMNDALAGGALDLDLAELNLNYYTSVANQDSDKAVKLRTFYTSSNQEKIGGQTYLRTRTHTPSKQDLADAEALEQESKDLRVRAHDPLAKLINSTQDSSDPAVKAVNAVAWAHHWEWIGENKKAVGAAVAGVEAQPYNLKALDYLIELCPKVGVPELGQKYRDQKDSLANPSPNARLRAFQADLKSGHDDAAAADLEQARAIDPSSTAVRLAALDLAVHRHRLDDIAIAAKLIAAMEEGRMRMSGRTLNPDAAGHISFADARISITACLIAGKATEDAGRDREAVAEYERGLWIARRVPAAEVFAPGSSRAPPLSSQPELGPEDRADDLHGAMYDAHRRCAARLLAGNDAASALPHCLAMLRLTQTPDADKAAEQIGYRIYQKLGWPALGGPLPVRWQADFANWDRHPEQIGASATDLPQAQGANGPPNQAGNAEPPHTVIQRPDGSRVVR
jgi:hypothetical protein